MGFRRVEALLVATLLAIALSASPPAVGTALAAEPLRIQADATYTLDPGAGRVHIAIDFKATNLKPNSASFIYYYRDIAFAIQPEATSIRASDGRGAIGIKTRKHEFYVEATVHLRANLYYRNSTSFTIRYDLVGGAPRSDSAIRVGKAFATFGVWAWGDVGRSTVEVRTPAGFANDIDGGPMSITAEPSGQTLRAAPADPNNFYAIVTSENHQAYSSTRISLEGGVEIVVMAWPEDKAWDATVSETLRTGLPKLRELIGLDWPVEHDLDVLERYTPSLEGYAGFFFTDAERIDISEDLDPVVIVHEASHAWLNEALFIDRWIYEGLAQEYAYRVLNALGEEDGGLAESPDPSDPGFVELRAWTFPQVIRDQETDDRERYGYQAAFYAIHRIATVAGIEGMRAAFAAADANVTAYPGAGTPEIVSVTDDWQRLVDLIETPDRPDSADIERILRDLVLRRTEITDLRDRSDARAVYRDLLETGEGWLAPWYVRKPMGEWRFDTATDRMTEATAVLALRDQVDAAAGSLELTPDGALRKAYESAQDGFEGATAVGTDQLEALAAVADARTKVDAPTEFVAQLGLMGETPRVPYEAARTAFEAGQLEQAVTSAAAAAAIITGAPAVGQQRLLMIVGAAVVALLLLILLVVLLRRRGQRRRAMALALAGPAFATAAPAIEDPAPTEPYATLAADPAAAPPPSSAGPPDVEGGPERGDSPADP